MNNTKNDGGSAFPAPMNGPDGCTQYGISLRDWFAGQAMQGMLAAGEGPWQPKNDEQLSAWAYKTADAMIAARNS